MPRRRGGSSHDTLNAWPGFVDALSTLLMVIIFVLLVFVLAQAFLSVALSGRDQALTQLHRQMSEMSDMLALEHGRSDTLRVSIGRLNQDLQSATTERASLAQQLAALRLDQARIGAERDQLKASRDGMAARLADDQLQAQAAQARNTTLEAQLAAAAKRTDTAGQGAASVSAQLADAQQQLAAARADAAEMRRQAAALDRTVLADRGAIEAKLSDLAHLTEQLNALTALRDSLERQAQDAAVRATTAEERRAAVALQLNDETKLADSTQAQVALMAREAEDMRAQLGRVQAALDLTDSADKGKDVQIANLSSQLNNALTRKVEELQQYRSEFFGRLRQVLADQPGIQVVGDRFVFQSEVLFPSGSADMTQGGLQQIARLAQTLKEISGRIPSDVNWLLRVDGHADRKLTTGTQYGSNWDLSAARAIKVVELLAAEGIPPNRLAATAFGENQPLDPANTPEAYAKNRRIEIRLTDR